MTGKRGSPFDRVTRRCFAEERGYESMCWIFQGCVSSNGYGQIGVGTKAAGDKRLTSTHRVVYEHYFGRIPEGMQLDHLCRQRDCCNPSHLEVVTNRENQLRGLHGVLQTHCKRGHEWTPENTGRNRLASGHWGRRCRQCHREQMARAKRSAGAA